MTKHRLLYQKNKNRVSKTLTYCILIPLAVFTMIPFSWMFLSAFKTTKELYHIPLIILPNAPTMENFLYIITHKYMGVWLQNTVLLAVVNLLFITVSSILVAYGFAKFNVKGRDAIFMVLLSTMMIPWAVTMIPSFVIFSKLKMLGTYLPLMLPSLGGSAFYIFMLRQSMTGIPAELEEAASIDGCNSFHILWRIIVPNCKPVIMTMIIFSFMGTWGDFLGPFIYINDLKMFTLSLGVNSLRVHYDSVQWNYIMAASALFALPTVLLYFFGTRVFKNGLVMSGIK